jgi:hypothetical protein
MVGTILAEGARLVEAMTPASQATSYVTGYKQIIITSRGRMVESRLLSALIST